MGLVLGVDCKDMNYSAAEDVVFCLKNMQAGQFDWKENSYRSLELPPVPLDERGKWILGIISCGDAEEGSLCALYKVVCAGQGFDTHVTQRWANRRQSHVNRSPKRAGRCV